MFEPIATYAKNFIDVDQIDIKKKGIFYLKKLKYKNELKDSVIRITFL